MATHNKLIISIDDIDLEIAEVKYYKRSQQIAEFNHDENLKVLHNICRIRVTEQDIDNILYVVSLIELLGLKYISFAKTLHDQNFMILNNDMIETIGKYIDWQSYTASAYTIVMRTACKIINEKYYADALKA